MDELAQALEAARLERKAADARALAAAQRAQAASRPAPDFRDYDPSSLPPSASSLRQFAGEDSGAAARRAARALAWYSAGAAADRPHAPQAQQAQQAAWLVDQEAAAAAAAAVAAREAAIAHALLLSQSAAGSRSESAQCAARRAGATDTLVVNQVLAGARRDADAAAEASRKAAPMVALVVDDGPQDSVVRTEFRGYTDAQNAAVLAERDRQMEQEAARLAAAGAADRAGAVHACLVTRAQHQAAAGVEAFRKAQAAQAASHVDKQRAEKLKADADAAADRRTPNVAEAFQARFATSAR